ncbi:hypothetical protein AVEN_90042-1, partial [Araneus ventricosus]
MDRPSSSGKADANASSSAPMQMQRRIFNLSGMIYLLRFNHLFNNNTT